MRCTVRTFSDNGPYFPPTVMQYQASSLKDVLFHTRLAMEDKEHCIAVFHDDLCVGVWEDDSEPEPDGEGSWYMPRGNYLLRRLGGPMAGHFNSLARLCAGAGS
jgi:hypothetical protein